MPNIELLEKSTPTAPIRIVALAGCQDLAKEVDKKLVKFRKELAAKKKPSTIPQGYSLPSFLVDSEIIRSVQAKVRDTSKNLFVVQIFLSWLISQTTALLTRSAVMRTICLRITTIRI